MKAWRALAVAAALAIQAAPAPAASVDAALRMVTGAPRLNASFGAMVYESALKAPTYLMIVARIGPEQAQAVVRAEAARAVPRHQDEWDQNLARAWAPLLTDAQCASLARLGGSSPFRARFEAAAPRGGAAMEASSGPLLNRTVAEIMYASYARALDMPVPAPAAPR
jgi:hypothetical protein